MHHISYFLNELQSGKKLCLMPLGRCLVEQPTELSKGIIIYPPNYFSPNDLNIVSWPARDFFDPSMNKNLAWVRSSATGITPEEFLSSALVCLSIDLDWPTFFNPKSHEYYSNLIREFSEKVEETIDMIRFKYCRLDCTDSLPGKVGLLGNGPFSCAQFYDLSNHESYIVAGQILTHTVIRGIGLEMHNMKPQVILGSGELGYIARHGLRMFSQALEANTLTNKFIQSIFLIEYLADPNKYLRMEDVKKKIAFHVARDWTQYNEILDYFKDLASNNTTVKGWRTQVVHYGKRIEDIFQQKEDIDKNLLTLQRYISSVLQDFIDNSTHDWSYMCQFRRMKASALGVAKENIL